MINLGVSVERVIVQFKMRDPGDLPKVARQMARNRKNPSRESGEKVIEHTPDVSLGEFVRELEATGFDLVNLLHDERESESAGAYQVYHVGRFVFVRKEMVSATFESGQANLARIELHRLCKRSLWRVCGYVNPIRRNGETVAGMHEVSINLDSRRPLFESDGVPVRIWGKPKSRRNPGDQPTPLGSKHLLIVKDGGIIVVPVPVSVEQEAEPAVDSAEPTLQPIAEATKTEVLPKPQAAQTASMASASNSAVPLRTNYEPTMPRGKGRRQTPGKRSPGWNERDN